MVASCDFINARKVEPRAVLVCLPWDLVHNYPISWWTVFIPLIRTYLLHGLRMQPPEIGYVTESLVYIDDDGQSVSFLVVRVTI